jgi:hypothetical protein
MGTLIRVAFCYSQARGYSTQSLPTIARRRTNSFVTTALHRSVTSARKSGHRSLLQPTLATSTGDCQSGPRRACPITPAKKQSHEEEGEEESSCTLSSASPLHLAGTKRALSLHVVGRRLDLRNAWWDWSGRGIHRKSKPMPSECDESVVAPTMSRYQ